MADDNKISIENISEENGKVHVEITHKYPIGAVIVGFAAGKIIWEVLSCLLNQLLQ